MKIILILLFLAILQFNVFAQDSTQLELVNKSNVNFELGGVAMFGSLNYEHLVLYKPNEKVILRSGLSFIPVIFSSNQKNIDPLIPIGIYYLIGNKNHLEIGINNVFRYALDDEKIKVSSNFSIGYRFQNFHLKSMSFSVAFSPLIDFSGSANINNWGLLPWAKVGIGYSFNSKNVKKQSKSNQSDTLKNNNSFFIEFGSHFLTTPQSSISKNRDNVSLNSHLSSEIRFPIDTINIVVNSLVVNRRILPTFAAGIIFPRYELKAEFAYASYKSLFKDYEYTYKKASFNSKECFFLIGYSYTNLKNTKRKLNSNMSFYIGANLLYQYKDRDFYYAFEDDFNNPNPISSEILNSNFTSNHISLLPDAGLKFGYKTKVYLKLGVCFNTVSYAFGNFSWNYKTRDGFFDPIETYTKDSGKFSDFLLAGDNKYFKFVDNVYFKLGFPF